MTALFKRFVRFLLLLPAICAAQNKDSLQVMEEEEHVEMVEHPLSVTGTLEIKAILPDGSHAVLTCVDGNHMCVIVQSLPPEKLPPKSQACSVTAPAGGNTESTVCKYKDVGSFRFKRNGDRINHLAPSWKNCV